MSLVLSPSNNFISNTFRTIEAPLRRGKGYPRREVKSIQGQKHPSMLPWTYNEHLDERLALNSWCLFFWTSKSEFKHYKQSIRSSNFVTLKIIATVKHLVSRHVILRDLSVPCSGQIAPHQDVVSLHSHHDVERLEVGCWKFKGNLLHQQVQCVPHVQHVNCVTHVPRVKCVTHVPHVKCVTHVQNVKWTLHAEHAFFNIPLTTSTKLNTISLHQNFSFNDGQFFNDQ